MLLKLRPLDEVCARSLTVLKRWGEILVVESKEVGNCQLWGLRRGKNKNCTNFLVIILKLHNEIRVSRYMTDKNQT